MTTPAHDDGLGMERDELLRQSLLQLIAYHANQVTTAEMMRDQLIYLAHEFGARPKDIASAADLTSARVHQVVKREREQATLRQLAAQSRPIDLALPTRTAPKRGE